MAHVNYTSRSDGKSQIDVVIWTVPKFYQMLLENKTTKELRTEKAKDAEFSQGNRFQLKMQFLGRNNDIIEIYYLCPSLVFLKPTLSICLKRFEEQCICTKEYHANQPNKWQYLTTFYTKDICHDSQGKFLLSDGSFRLKFQFTVSDDIKVNKPFIPETQLSSDFENLLRDGLFSDVVMKSIDGKAFNVHKAVLASRSAVLKALFEHNTIECHTNVVESPLESDVLKEVLSFIYSDKAQVDNMPQKLLAAADYYQLSRLKSLCEDALSRSLSVENAIETLQLADLHSASHLKQLILEFIKDGQAKLITKTEAWSEINSVDLVKSIYEHIVSDDLDVDIK